MSKLKVNLDGTVVVVERKKYVRLKTKDLIEFGYAGLTEKTVDEQVTAVLEKKELNNGLSVVGGFMQDEILEELP